MFLYFLVAVIIVLLSMKWITYNRFKYRFEYVKGTDDLPVDMVYCISMPDRINYVEKQMKTIGTSYKLFHAISPKDLNTLDYFLMSTTYWPKSDIRYKFTKLPVALSFFMCYYDAYVNGYKSICIFEDDIKLKVNVSEISDLIKQFKETDKNILFMGYCIMKKCKKENFTQISPDIYTVSPKSDILCNHAMVMKRDLFARYVNRSPFLFYFVQNDRTLSNYILKNNIERCVPKHTYIDQNFAELGTNNGNYQNANLKSCVL
jgi:GR25 family glycosyltransferase involved in LPS biosynthesis